MTTAFVNDRSTPVGLKERLAPCHEADTLIDETLSDLHHPHPLVSGLALQRFVSRLRHLEYTELSTLALCLAHRSLETSPLQQMSQLVGNALAARSAQVSA